MVIYCNDCRVGYKDLPDAVIPAFRKWKEIEHTTECLIHASEDELSYLTKTFDGQLECLLHGRECPTLTKNSKWYHKLLGYKPCEWFVLRRTVNE